MIFPILSILIGTAAAAFAALGTNLWWMRFEKGLQIMMAARIYRWPVIVMAGVCAVVLIALVMSGKNRKWWLIGLLPIIAVGMIPMFQTPERVWLIEEPAIVTPSQAPFLRDDTRVAGIVMGDESWAVAISALEEFRAVLLQDREKRVLLISSPAAGRLLAFSLDREMKLRDLEYLGSPNGATVLYDRRLGQFINGVTGLTPGGAKPIGFRSELDVIKTSWIGWRTARPETHVVQMVPSDNARPAGASAIIATTQPVIIPSKDIGVWPVNLNSPSGPILIVRDPSTGALKAFDRTLEEDLVVRLVQNQDPKRHNVLWIDENTGTGWSRMGVAQDGPKEHVGEKLRPLRLEDGVESEVLKKWYPDSTVVSIKDEMLGKPSPPPTTKPAATRRVRKR